MKYAVVTFGCRVNQADSLAIEARLCGGGAEAVPVEQANVVIVNTCSVTASADQGARQTIRRIARNNPTAKIIATGCYATRCSDEVAALPGVIAVVPNDDKLTFLRTLEPSEGHCGHLLSPGLMGRTAWTLRVQTGCGEHCSYCIIPSTRGASRSRTIEDVLDEVARVVAAGYKEIAITGVHLGSYGRDLDPKCSLFELLQNASAKAKALNNTFEGPGFPGLSERRRVEGSPGILFRISSLEPMDCTSEVVDLIVGSSNFAPHLHLPLQHASNRLLSLMRRPYTIEQYADLVDAIRARIPHAAIGSDVIVGFPGETDEDFACLANYLEGSPLTHIHVFPYSDRPGTDASSMPNKVHGTIVKARGERVRQISRKLQERFRASLVGTVRPALTIEDGSVAMTDNYIRISVPAGHARNEWTSATL